MRHSGQRQLRSGQAGTSKHTPGMHESISINIKTLSYYYEEMLEAGLDQAKWGLYLHTAELSRRPQDPRMLESPACPTSLQNLLLLIPSSWNPVLT